MIQLKAQVSRATLYKKLNQLSVSAGSNDGLVMRALAQIGFMVQGEAKRSILEHRTKGETVTRYGPKRKVSPSLPGAPPNQDRGGLAKSILVELDASRLLVKVGTNLKYARALELGNPRQGLEPRPFLKPAFDMFKGKLLSMLKAEWIYTRSRVK